MDATLKKYTVTCRKLGLSLYGMSYCVTLVDTVVCSKIFCAFEIHKSKIEYGNNHRLKNTNNCM